jgi:hypothetical protein
MSSPEPTQAQLDKAARAISGCHCDRAREAYDRRVKAGTREPTKIHAYNGQLLHEAGSMLTWKPRPTEGVS